MRDLVLGIDVGTGTAKAVIADVSGAVLWQAAASYQHHAPESEWAEQDPEDWWQAVSIATKTLFRDHPGSAKRIAAVGVSGQGAGVVLLNNTGVAVRHAILWLDRRCAADAEELQSRNCKVFSQISGKVPASYNFDLKLRWLKEHEPNAWAQAAKACTATGFITYRLTAQAVTNHSDGGIFLAYDLANRCWSEEVLSLLHLSELMYCDLAECDEIIGHVTAEASRCTGIPAGVPVVAGGEDTSSAGLAMGVTTQDTAQLSSGTANTVYVPIDRPFTHPKLLTFPHVLPGKNLIGGSIASGGLAIDWMARILFASRDTPTAQEMEELTANAAEVGVGADGLIFLPYLVGELQPINDGFARGVFFGLNAEMHRGHMMRAIFESNALAIEHNLSLARSFGIAPSRLVAVGGPMRNVLLCQIIADVTGMPLHVMEEHGGAALGSAMLAAKGAGLISRYDEMQTAHARLRHHYAPDMVRHQLYQDIFLTYLELYPRLKDLFPRVAALQVKTAEACNVHI